MTEYEKEKKLLKDLAEMNLKAKHPEKTYVRVYGNSESPNHPERTYVRVYGNSESRMALGGLPLPGESYLVEEKKINLE